MIEKNHFVYALICPLDNQIKYIGRSCQYMKRMSSYKSCNGSNKEVTKWLSYLKINNKLPIIKILESHISEKKIIKRESHYIKKCVLEKVSILNICKSSLINKYPIQNIASYKRKWLLLNKKRKTIPYYSYKDINFKFNLISNIIHDHIGSTGHPHYNRTLINNHK